jgi:hypothetical protein
MICHAFQQLPNPVALRFALGSAGGVFWLRLAATSNTVQRIDDEAF